MDKIIDKNGVKIMGEKNILNKLPISASNLYAKNLLNFVQLMVKDKKIEIDWEDEILKKSCVSYDGKVLNI